MVGFLRAFGAEPILHACGTLRDMPFCPALDGSEAQLAERWREFARNSSGLSSVLFLTLFSVTACRALA